MSMSDPIADLLTRIRNAQMVAKPTVSVPSSKVKIAIAQVLQDEGYIDGFKVKTEDGKSQLEIALKYYAGRPVIERIERLRTVEGDAACAALFPGQDPVAHRSRSAIRLRVMINRMISLVPSRI